MMHSLDADKAVAFARALRAYERAVGSHYAGKLPAESLAELLLGALHWGDAHGVLVDGALAAAETALLARLERGGAPCRE